MCTIPPPPPLPAMSDAKPVKTVIIVEANESSTDDSPNICQWALEFPELRQSCMKYNICISEPPFRYSYKWFESILQIGPTCGLVALSMLVKGEASPDELLSIAKLEGYSNNGEMFSCEQMVRLAEKAHSLAEIDNVKCTLKQGGLFSTEIVKILLNGAVLLVPYDADFNHSPCLRNGHTAHWALVCGVIIVKEKDEPFDDPENVYVLCKHGKSSYLAIWKLSTLAESNNNLWEFSPKKGTDGLIYILPVGGIGGEYGLRDQFLIFEKY